MSDWKNSCPWYERAVFYHIYPLGMCGVPKRREDFQPKEAPERHFEEMEELLPHLKRLGITALYIGPLFESEGHGYETADYYKVDARLGDNRGFRHFVDRCHEAGIRVVVDGVFNHSGRSFFAFQDLKQKREGSAYRDWYCNVNFGGNNEFNDGFSYEAWHGYNILPRLNLWNPAVRGYLLDAVRFWCREFDIDGIRLDCADVLHFDFMKELRALANGIKPDFWLMGEVIHGDYSRWVNRDTLHSVTNYELHKGLYSGHNDHNYFEIAHTIRRLFGQGGGIVREGRLYTFVENHDVNRLIDKVSLPEHMKNIYLLSYTLPGIPSVYYGGEFRLHGVQAHGSDDAIRPAISPEQYRELTEKESSFVDYLAMLGRAKALLPALSTGSYEERLLTNRQYAFARCCPEQAVLIAANNDEAEARVSIRAEAGEYVDFETGERYSCENGSLAAGLPPHSGKLFVRGGFESSQAWNAAGDAAAAEESKAGRHAYGAENGEEAEAAEQNAGGPESTVSQLLAAAARHEAETRAQRLASGQKFEGVLIKESIEDESILDKMTVHRAELWKTERKPRYWTALHFSSEAADFPEAAARAMMEDPARGGSWFVDFRCGNIKYIVFRGCVLSYTIGSETEKQAVRESCLARGVKEEEMNWAEA